MRTTTHRLFFALWPSDDVRAELKKQVHPIINKHPAKKVPLQNWHITLAFLGNVSAETKQCVIEQAALVEGKSFDLQLDAFGFFKRASVVWLGAKKCPEPLTQLVEQLNDHLAYCAYQPDFKTFTPHLTLLRKARNGLEQVVINPVGWSVHEFALVESVTDEKGATYKVINRWNLA